MVIASSMGGPKAAGDGVPSEETRLASLLWPYDQRVRFLSEKFPFYKVFERNLVVTDQWL